MFITSCLLRLFDGTFYAIGDEGEWRAGLDPFLWDGMGNNKKWCIYSSRRNPAPSICNIECSSAGHGGASHQPGFAEKICTHARDFEYHICTRQRKICVAIGIPIKERVPAISQSLFR